MPKEIILGAHERIVAVTPERATGPGWINEIVWVHIVNYSTGKYRVESIQPDERTKEIDLLFDVAEAVSSKLVGSVPTKVETGTK